MLIIPFVLAGVVAWFNFNQTQISIQASEQQHNTDVGIAKYQQQEAVLVNYQKDISDLLLTYKLGSSKEGDEVREVARVRTLAALQDLDPVISSARKGALLQFLYEAGLINGKLINVNNNVINQSIIDLTSADLRGADLRGLDLHGINLYKAHLDGANLSGDPLWDAILQNATLSGADLSGANLNGAFLWETDLSGAHLHQIQLLKANLFGANLNGADLSEADLTGAYLLYAQLTPRCFEKGKVQECNKKGVAKVKADLSEAKLKDAYLGGADLQGANLSNADLTGADLTAANLRDTNYTEAKNYETPKKEADLTKWEVRNDGNTLWIANTASVTPPLPIYGKLDLHTGALQLRYAPESGRSEEPWGTSLILLPSLWTQDRVSCQTNREQQRYYCQGQDDKPVEYKDASGRYVPVTIENPIRQIKDRDLMLRFHGTIAGLTVTSTVTLHWPTWPTSNSISAYVSTKVEGNVNNVKLDTQNHPEEAFQPIILSSMHISSAQWDSRQAYADSKPFDFPSPGDTGNWIIQPQPSVIAQKFGLLGGASSWEKHAPTVEVQLKPPQTMRVTGWIGNSNDPNKDNVSVRCASAEVQAKWEYTLTVSSPEST